MIKESKMAPKAPGSSSFNSLSQIWPLVPSCLSPLTSPLDSAFSIFLLPSYSLPPLCPQFLHIQFSLQAPLSLKLLLLPFTRNYLDLPL